MAGALAVSVVVTRTVLDRHVNAHIDAELRHEIEEVGTLTARGTDAAGRPVTGVPALLKAAVDGATLDDNATMVGYLDGRAYVRSAKAPILRLDEDTRLAALWSGSSTAHVGSVATRAGQVRFGAVPVTRPGDPSRGVIVAALFVKPDKQIVSDVTRIMTETGLGALAVGFALAWVVAGRILTPIRHVTELARHISDSDLTARLPVRGTDDISQLTITFNAMLDRLEKAFRAQLCFIADAGHELRTPLTIIRGNLELLAARGDAAGRWQTIALVTDEIDRMTRMVNDLLASARTQQGDVLELETVDVGELTTELVSRAGALAERDWQLDGASGGTILADRQRISQAVLQLAQNAVQHTDPGATIGIGSAATVTGARWWVRNSGPGVAREERASVLSRLTRAGARRTGDDAGRGLAIVRSIAEAHDGSVRVDSSAHGATFTMLLPTEGPVTKDEQGPES